MKDVLCLSVFITLLKLNLPVSLLGHNMCVLTLSSSSPFSLEESLITPSHWPLKK